MSNATKPLRFSVDSLSVGDLEDIEEIAGAPFDEILTKLTSAGGNGLIGVPIKVLKALVFVIYRKSDPAFTLEDARNVQIGELEVVLAEPDPTVPADAEPSSSSATSGTSPRLKSAG